MKLLLLFSLLVSSVCFANNIEDLSAKSKVVLIGTVFQKETIIVNEVEGG